MDTNTRFRTAVWFYVLRPWAKVHFWVRDNITHRAEGRAFKEAVNKKVKKGAIVFLDENGNPEKEGA